MQGLIAGVVLPFVVNVFTALSTSERGNELPLDVPLMVGAALLAYLLTQRFLAPRIPPIAGVRRRDPRRGRDRPARHVPVHLRLARSGRDPAGVLLDGDRDRDAGAGGIAHRPSNIPSMIFMRGQGFDPPERIVYVVSAVGTIAGSFFGPVAVSLALPPVLLTAGPGAGERSIRYRSVFLPIAVGLGIALFASTAADLAVLVPSVLLLSMAGLALIGALIAALKEIAAGRSRSARWSPSRSRCPT